MSNPSSEKPDPDSAAQPLDDAELLAACEAIQGPAEVEEEAPDACGLATHRNEDVAANSQNELPILTPQDSRLKTQDFPSHHADPDPGSRLLVLLWCLWLLGSWASTLLMESAVPGVRWMVYAGMAGMMLMWPVLRLSQGSKNDVRLSPPLAPKAQPRPRLGPPEVTKPREFPPSFLLHPRPALVLAHVVRDWLSLMLVFQSVLWLLRLTSDWSIDQTLWLDGAIVGWTLATAAIIAWGRLGSGGLRRTVAMLLCAALLFAEPAAMALWELATAGGVNPNRIMRISPISTLEGLTASPVDWRLEPWATQVGCVLLAASLLWMALALRSRGASKHTD